VDGRGVMRCLLLYITHLARRKIVLGSLELANGPLQRVQSKGVLLVAKAVLGPIAAANCP
jgi:hypothetical protein